MSTNAEAGSFEVIKTYLEMREPPLPQVPPASQAYRIEQVFDCPTSFHRYLYREVGRHHHWLDRLDETDAQIREYLAQAGYELWLMSDQGAPAGYYELLRQADGSVQILYFGLLPEFIGRGLGKRLLQHAVTRAWELPATHVCVNTCTLDGPAALPNYLKAGFEVVGEERYLAAYVPERCDHCRNLEQART